MKNYDDHVVQYVLRFYSKYFLPEEEAALGAIVLDSDEGGDPYVRFPGEVSDLVKGKAEKLLKIDFRDLRRQIAKRIRNEYGDEIDSHICPECGRLPATPQASLCLWCGYTWGK